MKTILITISLVLLAILGCNNKDTEPSKWQEQKALGKIWPMVKAEGIQRIIFCETDVPDIEKWYVRFEVPAEAVDQTIQFIDKALKETKVKRDIWEVKRIKIVTKKGKYVLPINWTGQKIYGTDWLSTELRSYLREKGFAEPGANNEVNTPSHGEANQLE